MSASGIRRLVAAAVSDNRITKSEADGFIREAKKHVFDRVTEAEKRELRNALAVHGSKFDPEAKAALQRFLGVQPNTPIANPVEGGVVEAPKAWTDTYWPMAGDLSNPDGSPGSNLWAKDGALDKLDKLTEIRTGTRGRALETERTPALNWLIGKKSGMYVPSSTVREDDAERTTGVDFNGNGKIDADVKYDFLDAFGNFGKDGKTEGSMSVGWWGSCNDVAAAGVMFREPKRDVTIDGVTFTRADIRGLLAVVASDLATNTGWAGNRYDEELDTVVTRSGERLTGQIQSNVNLYVDGARRNGDMVTLDKVEQDITIRLTDGSTRTIPANEVKSLTREDRRDIAAHVFHTEVREWLKSGRGAVADRDNGSHVWNYNFYKVDDAVTTQAPQGVELSKLVGVNGKWQGGQVSFVERKMYYGDSEYPQTYRYWIETRDGKIVNSGWLSDNNPDFIWQPQGFSNWEGRINRNLGVDPKLVKEIYEKSIAD